MEAFFHAQTGHPVYGGEDFEFGALYTAVKDDFPDNRRIPEYMKLFKANNEREIRQKQSLIINNIGHIPNTDWKIEKTIFGRPKVLDRLPYGMVEKGLHLPTKERMVKKTFFGHQQALNLAVNEAYWLQRLEKTGYVPRCFGINTTDAQKPAIFLERMKKYVSLYDLLQSNCKLSHTTRILVAKQITKAVHRFHTNRIYHNDLKAENILIDISKLKEPKIKIKSFGVASDRKVKLDLPEGTLDAYCHLAPELRCGDFSTTTSDTYSLGVLFRALASGSEQSENLDFLGRLCMREDASCRPDFRTILEFLRTYLKYC